MVVATAVDGVFVVPVLVLPAVLVVERPLVVVVAVAVAWEFAASAWIDAASSK